MLGLGLGLGLSQTSILSGAPSTPANTVAPVISGPPLSGATLVGTAGTWTGSPVLTYQWQYDNSGTWADIPSATTLGGYTVALTYEGKAIRLLEIPNGVAGNGVASNSITPISGLRLWLDASDTSTITQSGGAVSQWNDKSGNGNHATQGTGANQPTTGTRTLNGLNTLDFDGTNDRMVLPSGLYSVPAGANTIFVVMNSDTTGSNVRFISGVDSASSSNFRYGMRGGAGGYELNNSTSYAPAAIATALDTNPHIIAMRRSGTSLKGVLDGVEGADSGTGANTTLLILILGANSNGSGEYFNGMMASAMMFNRSLSNAEMNQIGNYLANKWGVTWTTV